MKVSSSCLEQKEGRDCASHQISVFCYAPAASAAPGTATTMGDSWIRDKLISGSFRGELVRSSTPGMVVSNGKLVKTDIVRDVIFLYDGTVKTFEMKSELSRFGCKWDADNRSWRRDAPSEALKDALSIAKAEEKSRAKSEKDSAARAKKESNAWVRELIFIQVAAADAKLRAACFVGMPLARETTITPEARALAWEKHGMDVYGNPVLEL